MQFPDPNERPPSPIDAHAEKPPKDPAGVDASNEGDESNDEEYAEEVEAAVREANRVDAAEGMIYFYLINILYKQSIFII